MQDQQKVTTVTNSTDPNTAYPPTTAGPAATDVPTVSNSPLPAPVAADAVPVATVPVTAAPVAAVSVAAAPVAAVPVAAVPVAAVPVAAVPVARTASTIAEPTLASNRTVTRREVDNRVSNSETARRVVVFVFGIVQLLIGARIVLLLLAARHSNGLVAGILNISQPFVAPFEGILRANSLSTSGSVLDVAALLAIVGWAIVELVVIWILAIFARQPAVGQA